MRSEVGMGKVAHTVAPYAVMTLSNMSIAGMLAMLQSTLDPVHRVNPMVVTAYQQLVSASLLVSLSLLLDREQRKPSLRILSLTCLIGSLQIPVAQMLLVSSLQYITATVQSVGLNMIPVAVFVLAVITGREKFAWRSVYGQVKLWGVFASAMGAILVVLASESDSAGGGSGGAVHGFRTGVLMVAVAVLSLSVAYLLVERVAMEYSSDLTLSAMMNVFGTVQTFIFAAVMVRDSSSWKINTKSLELPFILYGRTLGNKWCRGFDFAKKQSSYYLELSYGASRSTLVMGIIVNGAFYFGQNWCIHKKGPVFGAAFSPSLVVFSFILELIFFQSKTNIKSVIGAVLVVGGLYLLLWAKTKDHNERGAPDRTGIWENSSTTPLIMASVEKTNDGL